jgi:hypothetical protein
MTTAAVRAAAPPVAEPQVEKESQQQEEGPVDLHVYAENPAYLERTAHRKRVYPTKGTIL